MPDEHARKQRPGMIISHEITTDLRAGGRRAARAKKRIRAALDAHDGAVKLAAESLGASRWTAIRWFEEHPELEEFARELREERGEAANRAAHARAALNRRRRRRQMKN